MCKKIIVLACIMMSLSSSVFAVSYVWMGAEGADWNTAANWNAPVVPTTGIAQFSVTHTSPNLNSGVTAVCDILRVGDTTAGSVLVVNGATINIGQIAYIGYALADIGTLNVNSGTINTGATNPANSKFYVGKSGNATLNVIGGAINIPGALTIAETTGTGWVHLNGGTINAADLLMSTAGAHLDLAGGTLILSGDKTGAIDTFVAAQKIKAFGGAAGSSVQRDYNVTNAGKTTVTGFILSPKATSPNPGNNATNTSVSLTLTWTAGLGATSHDVYFGTANPPASQGNFADASFTPSMLDPNKTYYWRVDEVSGSGTTTGDLWQLTTTKGQPVTPNPANDATGLPAHPILSWTGGLGATGHNVYLGTANPPVNLVSENQGATSFDPGNLEANAQYFWRVEEIYGSTVVAGPVWNFIIAKTKAEIITNDFCPLNGAINAPLSEMILSWSIGVGAVSHDVHFGTTNPPEFKVNQTTTTYPVGFLTPNTTYYWQIDEHDATGGITTGSVWSFTTGDPVGIYPYLTWRNDPTSTITVNWWNPAAEGDSSVDYGLTSSYGSTVTDANITIYHHVEITGLTPSTTYHYRIRSSDGTVGEDNTFVTGTVNPTSFSFIYSGDPRSTEFEDEPYLGRQEALCDWMATQDVAFTIEGGDTVWEGQSLRAMGKYWPDFFKAQRNLTKTKVVMHTLGNHEVQGGGTYFHWGDFYRKAVPANGPVSTDTLGRLYSFDYGNAHFVCCASYQVNWDVHKAWLREDLTAAKARGAKWIFAYMHYPLYTNTGHLPRQADMGALGPIFDEFGVSIAFGSHNHVYERWTPIITYFDTVTNPDAPVWTGKSVPDGEGTVYITNGIGGAEFNGINLTDPRLVAAFGSNNVNTTIATKVTISGDTCFVQAIRNDTGEVIDTYQVMPRLRKDDLNKDGITDIKDMGVLLDKWLGTGIWP